MSDTENETVETPRKFKLRRIKPKEDIIQKNLEPLKQNVQKKKRAQQAYYELHPFLRSSRKGPVHQRLGNKVPFHGTNTSAILPKRRLRLPGPNNFENNRRTRAFSIQNRINRIRANQQGLTTQNLQNNKRIRLRRTFNRHPSNLQVQFRNRDVANRTNSIERFKIVLTPDVQQEIAKIQQQFEGGQIIAPIRIKPVTTSIPTHMRFSNLQ